MDKEMNSIATLLRRRSGAKTRAAGMNISPGETTEIDQNTRPVEDDEIRRRAYEIWLREGRPEGRSEEHWQRAKVELHCCRR